MGLRKGSRCHYCDELADTIDHIVAKAWINRNLMNSIPMECHQKNMVPACSRCNFYKRHYRSDCDCLTCINAWENLAPFILPYTKKDIPLVAMAGALVVPDAEAAESFLDEEAG